MERKEMSIETKGKVATIAAICTVLFAIFSGVLIYVQSDQAFPLILGIGALIYGPLCLVLYIIELSRGVMSADTDEELDEAE